MPKHGPRSRVIACASMLMLGLSATLALSKPLDERAEVAAAALAPLRALIHSDARGLCDAFVPKVAARLAPVTSAQGGCVKRVKALQAEAQPLDTQQRDALRRIRVTHVTLKGNQAIAMIGFDFPLSLTRTNGKWRIATPAAVHLVPCGQWLVRGGTCASGGKVLALAFMTIVRQHGAGRISRIPVPPAVQHAGGRELREFKEGRSVALQTGCLACHRIDEDGNRGPGRPLTHIGSQLSEREIRHALIDPRAPMPSFKELPHRRRHALIRFLTLLK